MQASDAKELLIKYKAGKCSAGEIALLESWYLQLNGDRLTALSDDELKESEAEIWSSLVQGKTIDISSRYNWRRLAVAASVLFVVATVAYLWISPQKQQPVQLTMKLADIAPGTSKAILTLADGSNVLLDSTGRQTIVQNGASVSRQGSTLQYKESGEGAVTYNTLTTPRGGQFKLLLQDGTMVWLNAASSIRYPTFFKGESREVQVSGEVYFEVAHNTKMPFSVQVNENMKVQVIGTGFNINSYSEEPVINTTLLEGAIKVVKDGSSILLKPGEQAQVNNIKQAATVNKQLLNEAALTSVVAWKNGLFNFNGKTLKEVMRQLSRWYDIEVVYTGKETDVRFFGEIERVFTLDEVLAILEKSKVHFRRESARRVVVL